MPLATSKNEFIKAYYDKACALADITVNSVIKTNGFIHKSIDVDVVKAKAVVDALNKTYEEYDPNHSSGAKVKTLLGKIVHNCVLTELGRATTEAKRAGLIASPKREKKEKYFNYRGGVMPGDRLSQSANKAFDAHQYMEFEGWQERKEALIGQIKKYMMKLPIQDRLIIQFWMEDESTYTERSLAKLGMENTPKNANWVYQRKSKAINALKRNFGGHKPDYRDMPVELCDHEISLRASGDFNRASAPRKRTATVPVSSDKPFDYRKIAVALFDILFPDFGKDTTL